MNNKGQVLVIFIIIFPLLLLALGYTYDIGSSYYEKNKMYSVIDDSISYAFENTNYKEKINTLINKNIKDIKDIKIDSNDDYITITVEKNKNNIFIKDTVITATKKGMFESKRIVKG